MSPYTKLTPRRRTFGGYTQLWLASDHLLLLSNSRLSEQYKRFSFSDIQAIVVTQLPSRLVLQLATIAAALAWMSLWFFVDSRFARWAIEISGALALLWPILDIARGPRCRCFLRTRVSGELLAPVYRMNTADKFLALLRPVIEAAQGSLPAEAFVALEAPVEAPPGLASAPSYLPEFLFGTFLLNALLLWAWSRFPGTPELPGMLLTTLFAEFMLVVVALARRKGRDARVLIYVIIGLALVGVGFDIATFAGEVVRWYMATLDKARNGDKTIAPLSFLPQGGIRQTVAYAWRAVAGVFGMAAAFYERSKK